MRQDLLALTVDDLITLSNRGIVKRSQQEVQSGQLSYELNEDDKGNVSVRWSDDVECRLPSDRTLSNSQCTCPATTLCRHLIRSVLVYQQCKMTEPGRTEKIEHQSKENTSPSSNAPASVSSTSWNPGDIPDTTLAQFFKKTSLGRLKGQFDEGHVISLTRSSKPIAHIHTLSCTIRFLVADDIRYTHCDCAESAPCSHVPLVVWAFRLLETTQSSGIVATRQTPYSVPTALLDEIEQQLQQLAQVGISGASQAVGDRLRRLELRCREQGLIWLAEILAELVQEYVCYVNHDARFSPNHVVALIGELCIRSDAIRNDTGAVPQLFIRGSEADRVIEVGAARLVALGCGVQPKQHSAELTVYCQDVDSGTVVALCRNFPDPPEDSNEPPKDFHQLAQTPAIKGVSFLKLGTGQLLAKGGKRTPSYQFLPGRTPISFNPQAYQWESLRSPTLVEDFTELSHRLSTLLPASLRPRRLTENFYVCKVAAVEVAIFNTAEQIVQAVLRDRQGNLISLIHPYTARGRNGTENLLTALSQHPETLQFVAGQVRLSSQGLVIAPISLIFQQSSGRMMLQPWVDSLAPSPSVSPAPLCSHSPTLSPPHHHYLQQLTPALGELLLIGLQRVDAQTIRYWQELDRLGAALGFVRLLKPIQQLATALTQKSTTLQWDDQPVTEAILSIALLVKLAHEQLSNDD
ncbi:hypothetical protein NDA01_30000 [Trichocoleus desertorum AS-A10]|uniref:hypothetical protein n=1 Tax=Trichocoleus desertorum TaxID=1481672 RepID=UPI003297BD77